MPARWRKSRYQVDPPGYTAFKRLFWAFHSREGTPCGMCHGPIDYALKWPSKWSKSIGHIVPRSHGGAPMDWHNVRPEHLTCNTARSDRTHLDRAHVNAHDDAIALPRSRDGYSASREW